MSESAPYIGFTGSTIRRQPIVVPGDTFACPQCPDTHVYEWPTKGGSALFYRCRGRPYLGALEVTNEVGTEYRSVVGLRPDVSSGGTGRMESKATCWACWRAIEGDREPTRLTNVSESEPCWRCGEFTDSGIFYLVEK
jgi:hypothetical protein